MDYQFQPLKKCIYINPHVMDSIKNGHSKVLINPTFMKPPVVHFNPHFKANFTVHVNPNILKPLVETNAVMSSSPKPVEKVPLQPAKHITPTKVVRHSTKELVKNKYKKVNISLQKHPFRIDNRITTKAAVCQKDMARNPVKNKYKKVNNTLMHKHPFRIVNTTTKAVSFNKVTKRLTNPCIKNVYIKCNKKPVSTANLNRKLLRNTKLSLNKVSQLLLSSGKKYKMGVNNRTLSSVSNKSGKTPSRMAATHLRNVYVKNNMGKRLLLSQTRSTILLKSKLKKSNMPCPFYHKFGKCKGKENGTCIRIHNPDQVSLCPKFLQGSCLNKSCLLSHKVSAEKMPTCHFYLDGMCSKDDCPYLHVKISAKAEICRDFLEGFCKNGAECEKRHQYLCPHFEQKGSCRQRNCQYPHKKVVRDKVLRNLPSKLQTQINKIPKLKSHAATSQKEVPEKLLTVRYYDESLPEHVQPEGHSKMDDSSVDNANNGETNLERKRPSVGNLPSFIPL